MAKKKVGKKAEKKETKKVVKKTEPEVTSEELTEKILVEVEDLVDNMKKYIEKGTAAAAKRARKNTTNLAPLFKLYRKVTVLDAKKDD